METESTSQSATREGGFSVDDLFYASAHHGGAPVQFSLFDVQLCGSLSAAWLTGELEAAGMPSNQAKWMIDENLLSCWVNSEKEKGYLLYTLQQAQTLRTLVETGRYGTEELRHIMNEWDDYLEAIVMVEPAYDDMSVSDYQHLLRRANEMVKMFQEDDHNEAQFIVPTEERQRQTARYQSNQTHWETIVRLLEKHSDEELPPRLRELFDHNLFQLRWWDEFVRLNMAGQFEAVILQGYSPEVTFGGFSAHGLEFTLSNIDWFSTLRRYRDTRSEGKQFPLRAPDFHVTERGVEFVKTPSPTRYAEIYSQYQLGQLSSALEELGPSVWSPTELPLGDTTCPECQERFDRGSPRKVYCSDGCRKRAKSRRWRERDPERARLCQAKYWKSYSDLQ